MKLSKAQQEVMEKAKERIDYARNHSFYDWYRHNSGYWRIKEMSDAEIDAELAQREADEYKGTKEYEMTRYEMNKNGIDYLCHASSSTIKKLEMLGLIEIIKDSNGEYYGLDQIKILNY